MPSRLRTSAGTEICPCPVSFDRAGAMPAYCHAKATARSPYSRPPGPSMRGTGRSMRPGVAAPAPQPPALPGDAPRVAGTAARIERLPAARSAGTGRHTRSRPRCPATRLASPEPQRGSSGCLRPVLRERAATHAAARAARRRA
jgi:hypothetical protein